MSTELFVLMIILAICGFSISAGSLVTSIKDKTYNSTAGYGALSVLFFMEIVAYLIYMCKYFN